MSDNQTELRLQDEHELGGAPDNISLAVVIYDVRGGTAGTGTALICGVIATGFPPASRSQQHPSDAVVHPARASSK